MGTTVGLYDGQGHVHPDLFPPPGAGIPGLPLSEKAPEFSSPRCDLFRPVLAVGLLVFEVEVFDRISAPIARRLSAGSVGRAPRGRDGGLFAVSTPAWEVEVGVEDIDRISTSIGSRLCADRASSERLGDEGPLWRRVCD